MIYAIGDLHLDYTKEKSMDVFGDNWDNYEEKIFHNLEKLDDEDIILIPGDISWAMQLDDAFVDLKRIDKSPGRKILTRGNHDYWWSGISKLRKLELESINFIQNDSLDLGDINKQPNALFNCLKNYNVTDLIYGHLHGYGHQNVVEGTIDGIHVHCVSSDYIDFKVKKIRE